MSLIDHLLVVSYIVTLISITWFSVKAVAQSTATEERSERKSAERQFLAGRQATTIEAVFSIVATEFSAMTFVQIPAMAMLGRRGLLWGLFGIMLGRWIISRFLLRNFYRSGLTVFDSLTRGVKDYSTSSPSAKRAQRLMATIYFFSKVLSVAGAMFLGVSFVARFYGWPYYLVLTAVVLITASYTITGGLKAVMRTDILQFGTIMVGGLVLIVVAFLNIKDGELGHTVQLANTVAFGTSGLWPVLAGIASGFVSDFTTHGVEQDFVQKLKACRTPNIAAQAVAWSTGLTILLQVLFMCIGAVFIAGMPQVHGGLTAAINVFMDHTVSLLGPGARGLVVVAILSATMSSLDSSLNALSAVLWNDILPGERASKYPIFLKIDNAVVAAFVAMFAFFVGQHPMYVKGFLTLNSYVLLPLACCFLMRFVCYPRVLFGYGLHTVVFTIISCLIGWVINTVYLGLPQQTAIVFCLLMSIWTLWVYEKLKAWI